MGSLCRSPFISIYVTFSVEPDQEQTAYIPNRHRHWHWFRNIENTQSHDPKRSANL
jgi:hypothetical protein